MDALRSSWLRIFPGPRASRRFQYRYNMWIASLQASSVISADTLIESHQRTRVLENLPSYPFSLPKVKKCQNDCPLRSSTYQRCCYCWLHTSFYDFLDAMVCCCRDYRCRIFQTELLRNIRGEDAWTRKTGDKIGRASYQRSKYRKSATKHMGAKLESNHGGSSHTRTAVILGSILLLHESDRSAQFNSDREMVNARGSTFA